MAYATAAKATTLRSKGGNTATLVASFAEDSYSIENNTSNITVYASITQETGSFTQHASPMLYVDWWDDVRRIWETKASVNIRGLEKKQTRIVSWTFDVPHADNGSLNGIVRARWSYEGNSLYAPQSGEVATDLTALYHIPRYFTTMSISLGIREDEYSLPINWSTSEICDQVEYSLDAGKNWTKVGNTNSTSGNFIINKLQAGVSYTPYVRCRRKDSQLTTVKNGTWSTHPFPSLTKIDNADYTIGSGSISFTLNNPLKRECKVYMVASGKETDSSGNEIKYTVATNVPGGTTASLNPEADKLYKTITKQTSGNAIYYCEYIDTNESDEKVTHNSPSLTGIYKCNVSDCLPNVSTVNLRYKDLNTAVTEILNASSTGTSGWNDQCLVQNQSKLGIKFDAAKGNKFATIKEYKILLNNAQVGNPQSVAPINYIDLGKVTWNKDTKVSLMIVDSRGFSATTESIVVHTWPWSKPSISVAATRINDFNTTTIVTSDIVSFTQLINNGYDYNLGRRTLTYYYCEGNTFDEGKIINGINGTLVEISDNNKPIPVEVILDERNSYSFKFVLTDAFDKGEAYAFIGPGKPIMMIDAKQLGVGVNCFPKGRGLYIDGLLSLQGGIRGYSYDIPTTGFAIKYCHLLNITRPIETEKAADMYISFDVLQRNKQGTVYINFKAIDDENAITKGTLRVNKFLKRGDINVGYSYSNDNTTVSIFLETSNGDYGEITNIRYPEKMKDMIINFEGSYYSSLPDGWIEAIDCVYPVGSIYMSVENISPASLFGGTWIKITNKFLYGATDDNVGTETNAVNTTGASSASNTGSTILTAAQSGLPSHAHTYNQRAAAVYSYSYTSVASGYVIRGSNGFSIDHGYQSLTGNYHYGAPLDSATAASGGINAAEGHTHSMEHTHTQSLPPYLAVYIWKKIAESFSEEGGQ